MSAKTSEPQNQPEVKKVASYNEAAEAGFDARPVEDRTVTAKAVSNSAFDLAKFALPLLVALTLLYSFVPENVSPASLAANKKRLQREKELAEKKAQMQTTDAAAPQPKSDELR